MNQDIKCRVCKSFESMGKEYEENMARKPKERQTTETLKFFEEAKETGVEESRKAMIKCMEEKDIKNFEKEAGILS